MVKKLFQKKKDGDYTLYRVNGGEYRISASEPFMRWATPEWVAKAGAKGHEWGKGRTLSCWGESWKSEISLWEPVYDDSVYLEKVENFVKAMADRYDGNPNVSFIDVGNMGTWGE